MVSLLFYYKFYALFYTLLTPIVLLLALVESMTSRLLFNFLGPKLLLKFNKLKSGDGYALYLSVVFSFSFTCCSNLLLKSWNF